MKTQQRSANNAGNLITYSKINSMKLIQLVRSNDVLYNSDAESYTDKNHKELVWERIHRSLFANYDKLSDAAKDIIRTNVRRRWKSLRNGIAREVKKNATVENYCRKKESPLIAELEFLIPHIKSSHCAKLADELGLRECYSYANENEDPEDEDSNDLIDLTEEIDVKPEISFNEKIIHGDEANAATLSADIYYPLVQVHTNETNETNSNSISNPNATNNWSSSFCTLAQYKEGEFTNSTVLCASQENGESFLDEVKQPYTGRTPHSEPVSPRDSSKKRPRCETDDLGDLHNKVVQIITNLKKRERTEVNDNNDEDRMFLLSLVPDLKCLPAAKKMMVKAEIATTIARALQQ